MDEIRIVTPEVRALGALVQAWGAAHEHAKTCQPGVGCDAASLVDAIRIIEAHDELVRLGKPASGSPNTTVRLVPEANAGQAGMNDALKPK